MAPDIIFDGVWKKFHRGELHDSLRDLVPALFKRLVGKAPRRDALDKDEFWAVRDLSFRVQPGETLGIIGANGAGKSTTLKILTRILRPDVGQCVVPDNVGALIEIGAGFHPDLTGRENIFLQGAIRGMRKAEIARKFDEIVEYAGLGPFIDTQVKRYSSGMNARLGFSIAAHLEPDALLVDEVLSVGDYSFQRKAFARIAEMANRDIPVVIVSHQLERISQLCTHAILLEQGAPVFAGDPGETIAAYISRQTEAPSDDDSCPVRIESISLRSPNTVTSGEWLDLSITARTEEGAGDLNVEDLSIGVRVRELKGGKHLFSHGTSQSDLALPRRGRFEVRARLQMNLPATIYSVETAVWNLDRSEEAAKGPSATVQVVEGVPFVGSVQLNPRLELTSEPAGVSVGMQDAS